uniref:Sulfurtransferase n=1 Tax=Cyanothece sp. (strain PCC 7425 / ATCC 29141) TaxID=395961 RepID=B8HME6_CYAP4
MTEYAHPDVLVSTQWLEDHLTDADLRILEVDMSPEPYQQAHLPGAVFWNIFTDLLLPDLRMNLEQTHFEQLMGRSGISPESTVIAYGSYPGTGAWIFWLLKYFGHERVKVLNGGYQQWQREGRPLVAELSTFAARSYQSSGTAPDLRVCYQEVAEALDQPDRVVLDVRTSQEYRGEWFITQPPTSLERAGHIPGAVHIDHHLTLNEDGTFKSMTELQYFFFSKGVTPEKEILPYCAIGGRSGYIWFVLTYLLGYPQVRNYEGSWNEWSRLSHLPVQR